jgi:hypothetical protein
MMRVSEMENVWISFDEGKVTKMWKTMDKEIWNFDEFGSLKPVSIPANDCTDDGYDETDHYLNLTQSHAEHVHDEKEIWTDLN